MPRPFCCRRVEDEPRNTFFKPRGVPLAGLEVVTITVDEYEAVRLADLAGLYQEVAAKRMAVSRQTFGRIIESAHRKIAQALVHAQALEIKGGEIEIANPRQFHCVECGRRWQVPFGTGRPAECPRCRNRDIQRAPEERGQGWKGMRGLGAGPEESMRPARCWRREPPRVKFQGGNK
jgi:uncharacterized protein